MRFLFTILPLLFAASFVSAQKAAARYEIDAKRQGVSPVDKDALPRGREFVRLDSTYYVGWMYQGLYLHDRSVDVSGYQRALPLLRKAFLLIEKDYSGLLTTIYNDPMFYMQNNLRYNDYLVMARALREAYEYLEMPDSAMWVLGKVEKKNFRRDFLGIYGTKAWIIHRNRFYTNAQYRFLGNSVAENEKKALQACYDGFNYIRKNMAQNNLWFGESQSQMDRQFIYHYLALIHCYLKNYDSSNYYYQQMAEAGTISWNNYGSMKAEIGEFGEAIDMYNRDKYKYGGIKNLMEPYYYLPMLNIYAGNTKEAMDIAKEAIAYSNSSPGFGWYNLALSRSFMYNGQLDSAWIALEKAANFKEVHIGTTLTQPQYDFTVGLLKLVWFYQKINAIKFVHPNWWYHPIWFYEVAALEAKKYTHEYVLANQLALNPERARIIYDLFCGESTVSYDEVYYLMERFSPSYFMKLMTDYYKSDPRIRIKPYFELYQARLLWHREKYGEAGTIYTNLLNKSNIDSVNEKLFMARLYEGLWQKAVRDKNNSAAVKYQNLLFEYYPTLIPFSNLPFQLQLQTKGLNNALVQSVIKDLKTTSLNISNAKGIPKAILSFAQKGIKYEVTIDVYNENGILKFTERFLFKDTTDVAAEIAFRIFGKKGGIELEAAAAQPKTASKTNP